MIDLFGREYTEADLVRRKTKIGRILGPQHYRPAETKEERCATCARCELHEVWHRKVKRWRKCGLLGGGSPATDVRARWVCDAWEARP